MIFKGIVFDVGQTLIEYNIPLNWSELYIPALKYMAKQCNFNLSKEKINFAIDILTKYNTRVNPRDYEISSNVIFNTILENWDEPFEKILEAKESFYNFFRRESYPFAEVKDILLYLKKMNIKIATLSDVAYGMDNNFALDDILPLLNYIDYPITSNDVGFRKPNINGILYLAHQMKINLNEMIYVGDEEKDMICANNAGVYSVLINRTNTRKEYGQNMEIYSLMELKNLIN